MMWSSHSRFVFVGVAAYVLIPYTPRFLVADNAILYPTFFFVNDWLKVHDRCVSFVPMFCWLITSGKRESESFQSLMKIDERTYLMISGNE